MGKGTNAERELVNKLWDNGFAVVRSPSSGAGRKHPQPDMVISDGSRIFAIECKRTSKEKIYIKSEEIMQLVGFCQSFGSIPLIGVRFDYSPWYLLMLENLEKSKGDSYRVSKRSARKGVTVKKLSKS